MHETAGTTGKGSCLLSEVWGRAARIYANVLEGCAVRSMGVGAEWDSNPRTSQPKPLIALPRRLSSTMLGNFVRKKLWAGCAMVPQRPADDPFSERPLADSPNHLGYFYAISDTMATPLFAIRLQAVEKRPTCQGGSTVCPALLHSGYLAFSHSQQISTFGVRPR